MLILSVIETRQQFIVCANLAGKHRRMFERVLELVSKAADIPHLHITEGLHGERLLLSMARELFRHFGASAGEGMDRCGILVVYKKGECRAELPMGHVHLIDGHIHSSNGSKSGVNDRSAPSCPTSR